MKLPHGNAIKNKAEINLNVLRTLMLGWVTRHVDGAGIVAKHDCGLSKGIVQLLKKLPKPYILSYGINHCSIFGLHVGLRNGILVF